MNDTSLHEASCNGDLAAIRALLDQGVNIEEDNFGNGTALIIAVTAGQDEAVKLLLEYGASPEAMAVDEYGQERDIALLLAARLGRLGILQTLLGIKAKIELSY